MKSKFKDLENRINYVFKNKVFLITAFTHKSSDSENNYERLEFLGDRVLGIVISKKLLELYPNEKVGSLDKKFASLVIKARRESINFKPGQIDYLRAEIRNYYAISFNPCRATSCHCRKKCSKERQLSNRSWLLKLSLLSSWARNRCS